MRPLVVPKIALVAAASSACWAIAGLEDRPVGSASPDAGHADVAVGDAQTGGDAGTDGDATSPPDAPADVQPADGGDGSVRLCAAHPQAAICDDFDDYYDGSVGGTWKRDLQASGQITLGEPLGAPSTSPPNAVAFQCATSDNGAHARIERGIAGPLTKLTCTLDAYFDSLPAGGFEYAHVDVSGASSATKTITINSDQIKTPTANTGSAALVQGHWYQLKIVVDFTQAVQKASISRDGQTPDSVSIADFPSPETVTVSLGLQYIPTGDEKFHFDNVLCETN